MEKQGLFLMVRNRYGCLRDGCGNPLITGIHMVTPPGHSPRICYEVTFSDGFVDYVAMSDVENGGYAFVEDTWTGLTKNKVY